MRNYLQYRYKRYYIQTADGQSYETTRAQCLAPGESPTAEQNLCNPYKQRWFYDAEKRSYIVRLPRNEQSEMLYRMNSTYVRVEEKRYARNNACVLKNTGDCDNDCGNCQRERYPRIIELDKPLSNNDENDDGEPKFLDIGAEEKGYEEIEEREEAEALLAAAAVLPEKQRRLVRLYYYEEKTVEEIGRLFGVSHQAISQQLAVIKNKLKKYLDKY